MTYLVVKCQCDFSRYHENTSGSMRAMKILKLKHLQLSFKRLEEVTYQCRKLLCI